MARARREGLKLLTLEVDESLFDGVASLAARNGRSLRDEISSALRRHLHTPPVVVAVESPALEPEQVPAGLTPRRGRRPKGEE